MNRLEIYNSFTILCLTYCLLCFTPFVLDADARYQMGYVMIILTTQNILVNIFLIGQDPIRLLKLKIKSKWMRRNLIARQTTMFLKRIGTRLGMSTRAQQGSETKAVENLPLDTIHESSNESLDSDKSPKASKNSESVDMLRK